VLLVSQITNLTDSGGAHANGTPPRSSRAAELNTTKWHKNQRDSGTSKTPNHETAYHETLRARGVGYIQRVTI
jgi:hypothetical protein